VLFRSLKHWSTNP